MFKRFVLSKYFGIALSIFLVIGVVVGVASDAYAANATYACVPCSTNDCSGPLSAAHGGSALDIQALANTRGFGLPSADKHLDLPCTGPELFSLIATCSQAGQPSMVVIIFDPTDPTLSP